MKIRRDLIIVALAIFCLTATLFLIKPTKSDLGPGEYNPWADVNNDGTVDIYDAIGLSNSFGLNDTGVNSRNVNVTKSPAKTVEQDVNISIHSSGGPNPSGYGYGSTSIISTEGYDRMFVSAAIIDIGNKNNGSTQVYLEGVSWIWATINGKDMITLTPPDGYQVRPRVYYPSDLPVCNGTEEFTVKAAQCSVPFFAATWFTNGWVLLRVSVYLTVGTDSPPSVQNTQVTNWPYYQAQPAYQYQGPWENTTIINGDQWISVEVDVGGYSRMYISIVIVNASYHDVPVKTSVSLSYIAWNGYGSYEYVSSNVVNATYYGTSYPVYSQQVPPEFKTKNGYCYLSFEVSSEAFSGWIEWYPVVYLRNE
jgi:hypothetical protein